MQKNYTYPNSKKIDLVENFHGTDVADPYRWLEDPESDETKKWVSEQNKLTFEFLESSEKRQDIRNRITKLWNFEKFSTPFKEGNNYFYSKNDGLQNQAILYKQDSLDSEGTVFFNPNKISDDGTSALTKSEFSIDGKYWVYGVSKDGSDWQEIKIKNVETGEDLPEIINWCKFTGIAWKKDNSGFYYARFPEKGSVSEEDQFNHSKIYYHKLGTDQSEDVLFYERPDYKELGFSPFNTDDGKYLLVYVYLGTARKNRLYFKKMDGSDELIKLIDNPDAEYLPINNNDNILYVKTDLNAPKYKITAIDLNNYSRENWQDIIPESDDVIDSVKIVNNKFVISYMHNANHKLKVFDLKGNFINEINLPTLGSVEELSGEKEGDKLFFKFFSFIHPPSVYCYDFSKNELNLYKSPEVDFEPNNFETKQVFYESKDGTKVSMFVTHKKGLDLNADNPTILYGYGGFNISLTPLFYIARLHWLEQGGVFALANLRGGGEYGERWHHAGMLENKQNVFDDFISAGEWLIDNKYTSNKKLAIQGGSNGGLLVGACMVQRPDLFGAALCHVPVLDMLRYHKFTVGRYWIPEYGDAETNPDHFKFMYKYSPLHNVKEGETYPPTMVLTADTDDRVVPAHANKFAATLQEKDSGQNPLLIRIEKKAGHGMGKPTGKMIDEQTDIFSFLSKVMDI